jgi:hypothetical protein
MPTSSPGKSDIRRYIGRNDAKVQGTAGRVATTAHITLTAPAPPARHDGKGSISALTAHGWYSTTTGR